MTKMHKIHFFEPRPSKDSEKILRDWPNRGIMKVEKKCQYVWIMKEKATNPVKAILGAWGEFQNFI